MEGDCNVYALFAINAPITRMVYVLNFDNVVNLVNSVYIWKGKQELLTCFLSYLAESVQ